MDVTNSNDAVWYVEVDTGDEAGVEEIIEVMWRNILPENYYFSSIPVCA